ncbi:hypothetical protein ACEPAH_1892 [Sanghuangporus vaninii]
MSLDSFSDDDLRSWCNLLINNTQTIDPNCACLLSGGGPEMNTDISGPGVRISFYFQALFLGLISTRSESVEERASSLYMLICTNVALVITTFILGFRPDPNMSLHDAILVFYLLGLSWITIFFSLPAYNRFRKKDKILQGFYIFHSYLIFAFVLAVLIKAPTFGMSPRCNRHAVVVIFGDIPALSIGRIIACISIGIVIVIFTLLCVYDYKLPEQCKKIRAWMEERRKETASEESDGSEEANQAYEKPIEHKSKNRDRYAEAIDNGMFLTGVDGRLIINLIVIVVLWAIFVMNSELSIVHNHFDGGGDGIGPALWGFGQVFPMLMLVLPLVSLCQSFKELGLKKRRHRRRRHSHKQRRDMHDPESGHAPHRVFEDEERSPVHDHEPEHGHEHEHEGPRQPHELCDDSLRRTSADFRQQPGARISRTSLHSNDSSRYAEYNGPRRLRRGKDDVTVMSPSDSETYETASGNEK